MQLSVHARELYAVRITATDADGTPVPANEWEASFDDGTTWVAAAPLVEGSDTWSTWLVAGHRAEVGTAVAVLTRSLTPILRHTDTPEIVVPTSDVPRITLTR